MQYQFINKIQAPFLSLIPKFCNTKIFGLKAFSFSIEEMIPDLKKKYSEDQKGLFSKDAISYN